MCMYDVSAFNIGVHEQVGHVELIENWEMAF